MAPLIFLFGTFTVLYLTDKFLLGRKLGISLTGRIAMAVMLLVTGIAHFTLTEELIATMPEIMPLKREIVYFTGVCELLAVFGLLWSKTAKLTAIVLMVFFVLILPANIIGTLKSVPIGGMDYGVWYLLFRIPLQIFFIWWVYYFGIRTLNDRRPGA